MSKSGRRDDSCTNAQQGTNMRKIKTRWYYSISSGGYCEFIRCTLVSATDTLKQIFSSHASVPNYNYFTKLVSLW